MSKKKNKTEGVAVIKMCVDRYLTRSQQDRANNMAIQENKENLAHIPHGAAWGLLQPQKAALLTGAKWKSGREIKIGFLGGNKNSQDFVRAACVKWLDYADFKFTFVTAGTAADVRIDFKNDGAWSMIGSQGLVIPRNQSTMNFGWLDEGTVLHEFGHMLGLIHEHQHPKNGIPWNKDAVYKYFGGPPNNWDKATIDSNIFQKYSETITQFSEYDPKSIMHYAIDASLLTDPSRAVGWNTALSPTDKSFISLMYPKDVTLPPPVTGDTVAMKSSGTYSFKTIDGKQAIVFN
jgi:hypothetical protein